MKYLDTDRHFFGREETLSLLRRRLIDLKEGYRQNIAFLGSPYVGKSSVLKYFLQNLDDDFIPIYLDVDGKDIHYFYRKFSGWLLYHYARTERLPLQEDLNLLIETT